MVPLKSLGFSTRPRIPPPCRRPKPKPPIRGPLGGKVKVVGLFNFSLSLDIIIISELELILPGQAVKPQFLDKPCRS